MAIIHEDGAGKLKAVGKMRVPKQLIPKSQDGSEGHYLF
jgi:hypothetical protein